MRGHALVERVAARRGGVDPIAFGSHFDEGDSAFGPAFELRESIGAIRVHRDARLEDVCVVLADLPDVFVRNMERTALEIARPALVVAVVEREQQVARGVRRSAHERGEVLDELTVRILALRDAGGGEVETHPHPLEGMQERTHLRIHPAGAPRADSREMGVVVEELAAPEVRVHLVEESTRSTREGLPVLERERGRGTGESADHPGEEEHRRERESEDAHEKAAPPPATPGGECHRFVS